MSWKTCKPFRYGDYARVLQLCVNEKNVMQGRKIHAHMIISGTQPDNYLQTKMLIMYAKCNSLREARFILESIPFPNMVAWTAMISAYANNGQAEDALNILRHMKNKDEFVYAVSLPACSQTGHLRYGQEIHNHIIIEGFEQDDYIATALVVMYVKCASLRDARQVFDKMPVKKSTLWSAMIAGYANNGAIEEAIELFSEVPEPDIVCWNSVLTGYVHEGRVKEAYDIFYKMPIRDVVSWNTLIAGFGNVGQPDKAFALFKDMPNPDLVSWNSVIKAFVQGNKCHEVLELFDELQRLGVKPSNQTYTSVLCACASLGCLEKGKRIHEIIRRDQSESKNAFVGSSLMDMYIKCGSLGEAREVFDGLNRPDVVAWSIMISGYVINGYSSDALDLFKKMQGSGILPNSFTFVGALSACCHAGLLEQGLRLFDEMVFCYKVEPRKEHYCCIVDLLGRAGRVDEAYEVVKRMPMKPDVAVWVSLLSACRTHNHIQLGQYVAEQLFSSRTNDASHYVLISNIYAAAGRWDDVEKVRRMMRDIQIDETHLNLIHG